MTLTRLPIVLVNKNNVSVGASFSRYPTRGVCYHSLFGIRKSLRGQGLGGGMLAGIIRLLNMDKINGQENPFHAHKWFASYPEYNVAVETLYKDQRWALEGRLRMHTRAQTDLIVRAYYPQEQGDPPFWHESHPEVPVVEWQELLKVPSVPRQGDIFGEAKGVDQGRDGELW